MTDIYLIYDQKNSEFADSFVRNLKWSGIEYSLSGKMASGASLSGYNGDRQQIAILFITDEFLKSDFCLLEASAALMNNRIVVPVSRSYEYPDRLPPVLSPLFQRKWFIYYEHTGWNELIGWIRVWERDMENSAAASEKGGRLTDKNAVRPDSSFIERPRYADPLKEALLSPVSGKRMIFITGRPGTGKTTLARAVAWELRDHFSEIFYLPLGQGSLDTSEDISGLFRRLGYNVDAEEIREFSGDVLIIADDLPDDPDATQYFYGNTGHAGCIMNTRRLPADVLQWPVIDLDSEDGPVIPAIQDALSTSFGKEISANPDIPERVGRLLGTNVLSGAQFMKLANNQSGSLESLLDRLEKGIAVKYDVYLLGAPSDMTRIRQLHEKLADRNVSVVDDYSELDLLSYMGELQNLARFSRRMLVYCTRAAIEDGKWQEVLKQRYYDAVSDGTEVLLLGESGEAVLEFASKRNISPGRYFTGTVETLAETVAGYLQTEQRKRELRLHGDACEMYGSYVDGIGCYQSALELMDEEYEAVDMVQMQKHVAVMYEEMYEAYSGPDSYINPAGNLRSALDAYRQAERMAEKHHLPAEEYREEIRRVEAKIRELEGSSRGLEGRSRGLLLPEVHNSPDAGKGEDPYRRIHEKIAGYCDASIELFREMIRQNLSPEGLNCIKVSYTRLLGYCKTVGGMEDVVRKCLKELADVEKKFETGGTAEGSSDTAKKISRSYRMYLGLESLGIEHYDVFISYKSEDELLARRVYEYLLSRGKKVFLSRESLQKIGRDKYADTIYEVLDKTQHFLLVASRIDYISTGWIHDEWEYFTGEVREGRKKAICF